MVVHFWPGGGPISLSSFKIFRKILIRVLSERVQDKTQRDTHICELILREKERYRECKRKNKSEKKEIFNKYFY